MVYSAPFAAIAVNSPSAQNILSVPHPALARILSISQPGQLWPPTRVGEWFVVVQLEKFFPARLDDPTRQRLLDELFNTWLIERVQGLLQDNLTLAEES